MKLIKKNKPGVVKSESDVKKYADLRSVMDYTVPFKLIYSGVENESYFDILYSLGVRDFLMSHHYIRNSHISLKSRFSKYPGVRLFIDSGAYTYMCDPKYENMELEYWEDLLKSYIKWAEKNKNYIFAIANFDFEYIVGPDIVERWNREYFEPFMLRTGIPVCFVWHDDVTIRSWEYYCKRYPYVGFSSASNDGTRDISDYKSKLRVAENNGALVHGFGMTRTSMLTELPFYTSDSTTWLVGLQYGEINFWNNKMSRLKKDKWQGTYLETICSRYGLDRDLLLKEDVTEMIKANVHAFIDAEEYIHTRLKSSMYWLKAKSVVQDADNLPPDFFPPRPWFKDDDPPGAKEYAKKMNINPEVSNLLDIISDVTAFLNWDNPAYADFVDWYKSEEHSGVIDELHDQFINRIVPDKETKIRDLQQFYKDCISGSNDKLLHLETNFDRTIRERDSYIEDEEETELVDLSPEEVRVKLAGILPHNSDDEGMPEVTELDAEIFKDTDIVPCFDSRGKFLKGQTRIRKPKQLYSSKFPKVSCDTCYAAQKCPEFKSGYACAFNKMFERFDTRNMSDIIQAMQGMANFNLARMQRAMILENLTGNFDPNVTSFINQNMSILRGLRDIYNAGSAEVLRQTRVVRSDGSEEQTTTVTNPQSGGILEKLFSNLQGDEKEQDTIEGEIVSKKNDRYNDSETDE